MTMESARYSLWFVNGSASPGQACVYLDPSGVTTDFGSPTSLVWMVQPVNTGTMVRFDWSLDRTFLWVQYAPHRTQQLKPAVLGDSIPLSYNAFGFTFGSPAAGVEGSLSVAQDGSIPVGAPAVTGIGLHGAGTYGASVSTNKNYKFTPDVAPPYRINLLGNLISVNDPLNPATFSIASGDVAFPPNVTVMTAVLDVQNQWTISQGEPELSQSQQGAAKITQTLIYEAGVGLVKAIPGVS